MSKGAPKGNKNRWIDGRSLDKKRYYAEWYRTIKGRYSAYKRNTKNQRGERIRFSLTLEEFAKFWQKRCYYCGEKIETIGLDRIDSSKDYLIGNVVPCCHACNIIKGNLSIDGFIERATKIIKKLKIWQRLNVRRNN